MTTKRRVRSIEVRVSRPNEYTRWRPRREIGIDWREYVWGCVRVVVQR